MVVVVVKQINKYINGKKKTKKTTLASLKKKGSDLSSAKALLTTEEKHRVSLRRMEVPTPL